MTKLKFTKTSIYAAVVADAASVPAGGKIDYRGDIAQQLRDIFEEHDLESGADVLSIDYYADAWETVSSPEFDDVTPDELDFSGCESSLECLNVEANALIRQCYMNSIDSYVEELESVLQEVFSGADHYGELYELEICKGCKLADELPSLKFDAGDEDHVCKVWAADSEGMRELYINFNGLEFRGSIDTNDYQAE